MDKPIQHPSIDHIEEDVSFLDILTVIGHYKGMILGMTLIFTLVAVVVSLIMTPIYTGRSLVMPPQQQQSSASSALAGLSSVAGLAGGALGLKSQDDMYISFMTSEGFQKKIIERFELHSRYLADLLIDARQALNKHVRLGSDKKSSLMSIEVDDPDPVFAANMANAYVQELGIFLGKIAITEAQQRRLYFENQIKKTQDDLAQAETTFRETQERSGLQIPSAVADIGIKEIAELHGQIRARELQLQAMSSFATPQNAEVKKLMTELLAMRTHLGKLEMGSRTEGAKGALQQGALLAYRNMKVQESILESLVKQYEFAKVDESKDAPLVQVIDAATPPERRTSPKRTIIVLLSAMTGFALGLVMAFIRNTLLNAKESEVGREKLQALSRAWKL
jgi:uncharacterized protein involved in exopolysaccharide biosynthesis